MNSKYSCIPHSGTTSFYYNVPRYFIEKDNKLITEDELDPNDENSRFVNIELYVEASSHFYPGKTDGLPENCYEDDRDMEIVIMDSDGNDWLSKLSKSELSDVEDIVMENILNDHL